MILNEPAGQIARLVVRHVVQGVVKAWDDQSINAQQMVEQFLDVLHHPSFQNGSQLQREMFEYMRSWIGAEDKNYTLNALTKDAVRNHKNHRKGHATEEPSHGPGGYTSFLPTPSSLQNQATNYVHQQAQHIPGYSQYNQMFPTGPRRDFDAGDMSAQNVTHSPVGGTFGGSTAAAHQSYGGHNEPPHQYQQSHSPYPGQDHGQFAGQHALHHQGGGFPGPGGPPPHGGFGGPPHAPHGEFGGPAHAPHGGFGGPPPAAGWGGPPPPGQGWNAHPPHGGSTSPYPGAQYEQSHQGQHNQGGYPGSNWSANQPPPSGRW
jgi:hypothetical protein